MENLMEVAIPEAVEEKLVRASIQEQEELEKEEREQEQQEEKKEEEETKKSETDVKERKLNPCHKS